MKVFICNDFEGFYPTGTAAVIVAETITEAESRLVDELVRIGLKNQSVTLTEIPLDVVSVIILNDGDY